MIIENTQLDISLEQVLADLRNDLIKNDIKLFEKGFKDSGNNIMVQCPYHGDGQERRASAGFLKKDGTFHCFACGEIHTLPEVISHCFGKDDFGAYGWSWLIKKYRFVEIEDRKDIEYDLARNNSNSNSIRSGNSRYVPESELDSYRYFHPYMYKRKLTDPIIELFDIGYDKETECITFPVRDVLGNCLFVARRSVQYKYFNYPQGVEKPLYGLYELSQVAGWYGNSLSRISDDGNMYIGLNWNENIEDVIICESMLDALTCWVYGKYAVALNGLGNSTQFKQLREMPCRKLILATDSDKAGMQARERIRKNVPNKLITEYILPEGRKDINELSQEEFNNLEEVF